MLWSTCTTYRRRVRHAVAAPRSLLAEPRRSGLEDAGSGPQGGGSRPPRPIADEPRMPPVDSSRNMLGAHEAMTEIDLIR
jgi:hypothetical protein